MLLREAIQWSVGWFFRDVRIWLIGRVHALTVYGAVLFRTAMNNKRVNIFTNDIAELYKRPKLPVPEITAFCQQHQRRCGPGHERFYIQEEARWMNSWEEYKYVTSADYFVDVPVYHCASTIDRPCVLCGMTVDQHIKIPVEISSSLTGHTLYHPQCDGFLLRKWHNKYTHHSVFTPEIIDLNEYHHSKLTQ